MKESLKRRNFLTRFSVAFASALTVPSWLLGSDDKKNKNTMEKNSNPIISIEPMGFQWETLDPFLFCVHHEDNFPRGNDKMGPITSLSGRRLGDDFIIKDGFRMYHGKTVPGFPGHPHRGFETVTVVRKGLVDHADSMGAAGRYGNGDVQWMTAGKGVQHSEMFPLLKKEEENPMELFQIWINLPKKNKMVDPHFKMLWRETIPQYKYQDKAGHQTQVEIIAGNLDTVKAPTPPPNSWAAQASNEVAIWNIKMQANATWVMPLASPGINRKLYFYEGEGLSLAGKSIPKYHAVVLKSDSAIEIKAGADGASLLLLQGKPIGEPVIQYGPFVMNTKEEINQAFEDYHRTKFGGWPWAKYDQVHDRTKGRFARHADGTEEVKNV